METLHFDIHIQAPVATVYQTMLSDAGFRHWTAAFNPTSHFKGTWEAGSKMLFLGEDEEQGVGGMVSRIREVRPKEFISIEHLGIVQDGKEITTGPEIEQWAGAREEYTFVSEGPHTTLLKVTMDANAEWKSYFETTWPKALERLKDRCES
ncbi:SRPBCC domain-containing protein [Altibacter sp.]|uniref:SRPBCC domain-containing protein n=1 Tax=Altibacter sp. TaxID=2024823 RepID=UPI000C9867C4|nr:SRPBCC domain-containing protein [Altibacter sp.]MAP54946.1 hypothetical protein [Altibacter sp.]